MAGFDLVEQAKTYKTFAEAGAFSSDLRLRVVVSVLHGRTLNEIWSAMPRGNSMRDGTWEAIADSFHAIALTRPGDFKNWLTFASPKLKRPRTILGLASLTGLLRAGSVFDKAEKGTLHETAIGKLLESLLKEDFLCGIDFPIPRQGTDKDIKTYLDELGTAIKKFFFPESGKESRRTVMTDLAEALLPTIGTVEEFGIGYLRSFFISKLIHGHAASRTTPQKLHLLRETGDPK